MVTAIICGTTSYSRIEMFAHSRIEWLKKYIKLEYVLMKITLERIHSVFSEWMKSILANVHRVVAINGKQACRTFDSQKRSLPRCKCIHIRVCINFGSGCFQRKKQRDNSYPTSLMPHLDNYVKI